MDNIKKYVTKIIREAMSADFAAPSGPFGDAYGFISRHGGNKLLYDKNIGNATQLSVALKSGKLKIGEIDAVVLNKDTKQKLSDTGIWEKIKPTLPVNEETATGAIGVGAGPIDTPYAFAKKGQKTNKATTAALKQGFKKAPGMPKNSKMFDYKEMWPGKKSSMNEMENTSESIKVGDKLKHKSSRAEMVVTNIKGNNLTTKILSVGNLKTVKVGSVNKTNALLVGKTYDLIKENKSINNIIKEELLNEVTYSKFKSEVKLRTKNEQLHKAIKEVKRKLAEIDLIVEYTSRMKQELSEGEEGIKYWKNTQKNMATISEMVTNLNDKIKSLQE